MHHHGTSGSRAAPITLYLPRRQSQTHWSGAVRRIGFLVQLPLGHVFEKIRLKCHKHLNRRKVAPLPLSFGISRDGCTAGQVNDAIASTHVCLR
jgi:hypothetical protein